ncbi:MAG: D-amino-acid transaminase [Dongiaceae bacterium]
MSRVAYVNGRYVPQSHAQVAAEDRGYLFADGVYDVLPVHNGHLAFFDRHLDRLDRSLSELRIERPMSRAALMQVAREMVRRNGINDGTLYIQVTRGAAPRDHKFPKGVKPSLLMMARRRKPPAPELLAKGASVVTTADQRWARRDIKSIALIANVLAKQAAAEQGAYEAWLVDDDGMVTEGSSTSAWIATPNGELVTRPNGIDILPGITRSVVVDVARELGLTLQIRPFSRDEAYGAREALLTSTSNFVLPITRIDGKPVGDGKPGPIAARLREAYLKVARHG